MDTTPQVGGIIDPTMVEESQDEGKAPSPFRTPLLLVAVALLLAGVIGFFYTWPHYRDVADARETLTAQQDLKTQKELELARIVEDNKTPRELTEEEQAIVDMLPGDTDVPNLIRQLETLSYLDENTDFDDTFLGSFSIGEPVTDGAVRAIPINGSFSSSQYSLIDLLQTFEQSTNRVFNIQSISLSFSNRDGNSEKKASLFGNTGTDTLYQILIAKRQSFLITEDEEDDLADLQAEIEKEYNTLLAKRSSSETDIERLELLKQELDSLQSESQYSLSMRTYIDAAPAAK